MTLTSNKAGYELVGYSVNGEAIEGDSFTMPSADVTITAAFIPIVYIISYDLVGGILADGTTNPETYTVDSEDFTLNNPTRLGYTFTGWTLSGDSKIVDSDDLTISKGSTGNKTYIAGWNVITYTITYTLNGGSASNPATYTIESDTFKLTNPTRRGFTFTGWIGTGLTEATMSVTIPKGSTGDREYSAAWKTGGYTPTHGTDPEFVYHQLVLSGQLNMMFYVHIPEGLSLDACTMDFDVSGDKSQNAQGQH